MSHNVKKSIIVLGNGKSLKDAVIVNILGKDLSQVQNQSGSFNTEIYEGEDLKITCSPEQMKDEDIQKLLATNPDMCLLVVEENVPTPAVWEQIQNLSRTTGKPTEDFTVVPGYNSNYSFKLCSLGQLWALKKKDYVVFTDVKKSIIVLGNGKSLKEAVIVNILEKDLSQVQRQRGQFNTEIYEHGDLKITCSPEQMKNEDIQKLLATNPDMCLLVVEENVPTPAVWEQIQNLSRTTGKPPEDFTIVPSGYKSNYGFKLCTMGQFFASHKTAADRDQTQPKQRVNEAKPNQSTDAAVATGRGKLSGSTVNLVLLGRSGTGKSSSGNAILGRPYFMFRPSSKQNTTECKAEETQIRGRRVRVVDTPDVFDDELDKSDKNRHVTKCRQLCQSDPCVYLLVISLSTFTDGEKNILKKLEGAFGREARRQTIILFTRGDNLKYDDITMEEFLTNCQKDLKKIVDECERYVVFDNKAKSEHQVDELMQMVEKLSPGYYKC